MLEAGVLQPSLCLPDVARHQRLHPAVQGRGARALELPDFGEHLGAGADERVRPQLARDLGRAPLVGRIRVGVHEMDDERLASRVAQGGDCASKLVFVEGDDDTALRVHALGHIEPQLARNQRLEGAGEAPVVRPGAAAELEGVAEPAGRHESALRTLALQNRIGGDGGAVHDGLDARGRSTARVDARHEAVGLRARGARDLGDLEPAGLAVEGEHVGERTADVDSHPVTHSRISHVHRMFISRHPGLGPATAVCAPPPTRPRGRSM